MKSRDTLIRLKRFQVDEKRRRVAQIEMMIAEFDRMAADLDREIAARGAEGRHLGPGAFRLSDLCPRRRAASRQPPPVGPEPSIPARRGQGRTGRGLRGVEEGRDPGGSGALGRARAGECPRSSRHEPDRPPARGPRLRVGQLPPARTSAPDIPPPSRIGGGPFTRNGSGRYPTRDAGALPTGASSSPEARSRHPRRRLERQKPLEARVVGHLDRPLVGMKPERT